MWSSHDAIHLKDPHKYEHKTVTDTCINLETGWAWHTKILLRLNFSMVKCVSSIGRLLYHFTRHDVRGPPENEMYKIPHRVE